MSRIKKILKRPLYVILILAVIFAAWGVYAYWRSAKNPAYETVAVEKGDVIQQVSITGKVKSADSVDLAFEKGGKVATINVRVGDRISAGQRLASLTNSDLAAQLAQAQASLDKEVVKLSELKSGTRPEQIQIAQTAATNAEKTLADAIINLANVEKGARIDLDNYYDDIRDILNDAYIKSDDAVNKQTDELFTNDNSDNPDLTFYTGSQSGSDAESKRRLVGLDLAQFKTEIDNLPTTQKDLDASLISGENHLKTVLDFLNAASIAVNEAINLSSTNQTNYKYYINTGRTNVNTALTSVNAQKQSIAAQKATNQSSITTAQTSVNAAESSLAAAKDELTLKLAGSTADEIAAQEAQVKYAQANVQNYQAALSKTVIFSPIDGVITKKEAEVGEIVAANTTVISVLSLAKFEIEANVSENEIAKINLGDPVNLTLDALGPNEKFTGKIIKIDPAETVVSGVIYYKVTSILDTEDARIKSGMTVNMDIQTDKKEDVLLVPYYVVKGKNGEKYVQILKNGKVKEQIVKTGLEGDTMIEIIDGLTEGQTIVTQ